MEMENSLKQLDEYLEQIGRTGWDSEDRDDVKGVEKQPGNKAEDRDDVKGVEKQPGNIAEENLILKSNESHLQKSNEDYEEEPSLKIRDEKSRTFTVDSLPNKHNSINTESCNASVTVDCHLTQPDIGMPFEEQIHVEETSDLIENIKTESLHFVESEEAANELADIGLSEESLQEFALSRAPLDMAEKVDSGNGVSSAVEVHPVSLKKSTRPYEKSKSVSKKEPQGQVTTLLDLSSIGELKRLWVKSDKQVKKVSAKPSTSKQVDRKCIVSMTTKKSRKITESSNTGEINVKKTAKVRSKPATDELNEKSNTILDRNISAINYTTSLCTIPCSVKLIRVENFMNFENLKVDLGVAKKSTVIKVEDSDQVTGPAKFNRTGLNKKSDRVKKNVQSSITKLFKKVATTSKGKKLKQKAEVKTQKLTVPKDLSLTAQRNKSTVKNDVVNGVVTGGISDENLTDTEKTEAKQQSDEEPTIPFSEFDDIEDGYGMKEEKNKYDDDDGDDYFPSDDDKDDDYSPKKRSKKSKNKKTKSTNRAKDHIVVKTKTDYATAEIEVKAKSKKVKGTRIGRPPVLGHFECKYCDFTANEKNLIDKHHVKMHRVVLECKPCKKRFKTVNGILEHNAYKHDGGKPFKCDHEGCDYASKNPVDLERHKAKHDPEMRHVCDICGWRTRWRRNMRHHHALKHCDERNYKCTICEFAAKRPNDLKEHMYRHTDDKPIQCKTCGFRVKTNFELRSHMLVHSDVRPYKCTFPGCSSATKTKSDLTKHMRVHQTERPFKCQVCSKGYKDQNSLNKHLSGTHVAERKFKCDICGKTFKNRYALKKHVYLHSGYKPYECSICHWKFTSRNNMEKHMVTHDTNTRPFLCPLCPYAAKEPDHLFAHIGSYHGDKYAYFCELCKKPFKRYMQLKLHHERMHTKKEVESLKKLPTIDLALLKMEMKLELEEVEAKRKRRKSRSKSKTSSDFDIKEEQIDEDYEDTVKDFEEEEDVDDVRLNEDTGEIEVVKRKKPNKHSSQVYDDAGVNVERNSEVVNPDNVENDLEKFDESRTDGNKNEMAKDSAKENSEVNQIAGSKEVEENIVIVDDSNVDNSVRQENEEDDEQEDKKKETIYIAKSDISTVALYDNFRLPLATKGFKFNYDKTGKKPAKAWFMDTSLMDRQTAERHRKYRRRLGLLPPIPRGHPPKGYKRLKHFVDKRKRRLAENIKKAKFVKDLGLVSKRNMSRSKRFQGNYTEFETVEGEMLSIAQVQERLPKFQNLQADDVIKQKPNKTLLSKTKIITAKSKNQNKSEKTKGTPKFKPGVKTKCKKKPASKTTKNKTPKLLLSTEKRKQKKTIKFENESIRKPTYLGGKNEETSATGTMERNSFEALENILTEFNHSDSAVAKSENMHSGETAVPKKITGKKKSDLKAKSKTVPKSKVKSPKKPKEKDQTKPKYNKKYVPVKPPVKRKNNSGKKEAKKLKLAEVASDPHEISRNNNPGTKLSKKKQKCARTKQLKVKIGKDFGKSVTKKNPVQEEQEIVYPANEHVPVQNTQVVMVYPISALQTADVPESSEVGDQSDLFVTMNGGYSAVTESTVYTERVEFRRDLNDVVLDERAESDNEMNIMENSDKEIMQQEYAEAVVIKQEPNLTFYTSFAQDATAV